MVKTINNTLTLSEKIKLLDDVESGVNNTNELAEKYKINKSTVCRIIRNKDALRESAKKSNVQRRRQRQSIHGNLEDALNVWIEETKEQNIAITKDMATKKALEYAKQLKVNVYPGSSWIWRWLKRINVQFSDPKKESNNTQTPTDNQYENIFQGNFECLSIPTKAEICSSDEIVELLESSNSNQIQNDITLSKPVAPNQIRNKNIAQDKASCSQNLTKNYEKHRWLGDLVVTQMEEVHPDDRADFAWEIHKLIRKFQHRRKNRQVINDIE